MDFSFNYWNTTLHEAFASYQKFVDPGLRPLWMNFWEQKTKKLLILRPIIWQSPGFHMNFVIDTYRWLLELLISTKTVMCNPGLFEILAYLKRVFFGFFVLLSYDF